MYKSEVFCVLYGPPKPPFWVKIPVMPEKASPPAPVQWVNRIVGHEVVAASKILRHPLNFRQHPDTQRAAVAEAITRLGWIEEVLVNKTTGRLLNGHLRVALAEQRGETVPVTLVELTEAEERLALASLDPLGSLADQDSDKLMELLGGMEFSATIYLTHNSDGGTIESCPVGLLRQTSQIGGRAGRIAPYSHGDRKNRCRCRLLGGGVCLSCCSAGGFNCDISVQRRQEKLPPLLKSSAPQSDQSLFSLGGRL